MIFCPFVALQPDTFGHVLNLVGGFMEEPMRPRDFRVRVAITGVPKTHNKTPHATADSGAVLREVEM